MEQGKQASAAKKKTLSALLLTCDERNGDITLLVGSGRSSALLLSQIKSQLRVCSRNVEHMHIKLFKTRTACPTPPFKGGYFFSFSCHSLASLW